MKPTEHWLVGNRADILSLDRPRLRCILPKPQMRPRLVVVGQVFLHHSPQVLLAEHDHMVEAFPPDRSDDPFAVSVLPW